LTEENRADEKRMKLSIGMIVKNEEKWLPACLKSILSAIDEVIVVDTGSTDNTKEIAQYFGAFTFDFAWQGDFSRARNFSFLKANKPWVLWMDADEVMDKAGLKELKKFKKNPPAGCSTVYFPSVDRATKKGPASHAVYTPRLFHASADPVWIGAVHEAVSFRGDACFCAAKVIHTRPVEPTARERRNVAILTHNRNAGKPLTTRERYFYAMDLMATGNYKEAA